jgi:hypothetical protein
MIIQMLAMFDPRTSTRQIIPFLVAIGILTGLGSFQPAHATRIKWCMRVVPSGELVIRYGANWCKS